MAEAPSIVREANFFADNARIGQFISVEVVNESRFSFKTHLIGYKAGGYLLLEIPSLQEAGNVRENLPLDQNIIIRTICEKTTGGCVGFYSTVQGVVRVPYPVFFASYPQEVETRELRTEQRQATLLPAVMYLQEGGEQLAGNLVDLSAGGCRFEMVVPDTVAKLKATTMFLRFTDPESQLSRKCQARVCSQRKIGNRLSVGFAFMSAQSLSTQATAVHAEAIAEA